MAEYSQEISSVHVTDASLQHKRMTKVFYTSYHSNKCERRTLLKTTIFLSYDEKRKYRKGMDTKEASRII